MLENPCPVPDLLDITYLLLYMQPDVYARCIRTELMYDPRNTPHKFTMMHGELPVSPVWDILRDELVLGLFEPITGEHASIAREAEPLGDWIRITLDGVPYYALWNDVAGYATRLFQFVEPHDGPLQQLLAHAN